MPLHDSLRLAARLLTASLMLALFIVLLNRVYRIGFYQGYWSQTIHFKEGSEKEPIRVPYAVLSERRAETHEESQHAAP